MGIALAGGRSLPVRLRCGSFGTSRAFGHIPPLGPTPVLDAAAVRRDDGAVVVLLVHRCATAGPIDARLHVEGADRLPTRADVTTLAGDTWHARNTRADPTRVVPRTATVDVGADGAATLRLAPFSLTRVRLS